MRSSSSTTSTSTIAGLPSLSPKTRKRIVLLTAALICVGLVATIGALGNKSTITFRACVGILLAIFGCAQIHVSVVLFKNRHATLLELSQPIGLSLFALSGSIATFGAFTLTLPENDVACAIRQPIILTCLSQMGSLLVARAWRIGCLVVSPTLSVASPEEAKVDRLQLARTKVLRALSKLSRWTLVVGSCGRYRKSNAIKSLRKRVTFADSMRVTAVLVLPQVILQITNISVPSVRMESVEVYDDIHACQSNSGPLFLILGIVIAVIPFFVALLLNIKSEGMPEVFREFDQILACGKACVGVLTITLPTVGMLANAHPSAHAYLLAASLLSLILPLCYQIAWSKLHAMKRSKGKNYKQNALRRSPSLGSQSSSAGTRGDDIELLQIAEDAATSGKMFESMGNMVKAVEVNNDILTMFKKEGEYACDIGFTSAEINAFGPKTLKMVVSTLIKSGQRWASQSAAQHLLPEELQAMGQKACKSILDALSIFERAPAKASLDQRDFVLPGYSMLSTLISAGIANDSNLPDNQISSDLEIANASNFAKETQFQILHYCRALAMQAGTYARMLEFKDAFAVLDKMKSLYDPALHSAATAATYGTDHSANMIATSALWHQHLNQTEQALSVCDDVIRLILPEVESTNVNNSNILGINQVIFPIIRVLMTQGRVGADRAYALYNSHVVEPFNSGTKRMSPGSKLVRPMRIVLTCCSTALDQYNIPIKYDNMDDDVEWMLNGESKVMDAFDTDSTNRFSISFYSLLAEVCLHLTRRQDNRSVERYDLIEEGLRYSGLVESKAKDKEGNVTNLIVNEFHSHVHSELHVERQMSRQSSTIKGSIGSIQATL